MEKLSLKSLLIIVVILLIAIVGLWRIQQRGKSVMAGWYNDSWQYRKAITIGYTGASALTDFQVSVDVGTSALIAAGKMKSDCADIRFTDQTGKLLDYWIEENNPGCNQTTDTKIWIKLPRVNTTGTNIYLYYGNPSATTIQDGNKVFEFFDDFNGSSINTNKWNLNTINSITSSIVSGKLRITGCTTDATANYWIYNSSDVGSQHQANTSSTDNIIIDWSSTISDTVANQLGQAGMALITSADNKIHAYLNHTDWASSLDPKRYWHYEDTVGSEVAIDGETVQFSLKRSGNNVYYFVNGTQKTTGTLTSSPNKISLTCGIFSNSYPYLNYVEIDNVRVRKYAPSDPTKTLLTEEHSPAPIAYWSFDEGVGTSVFDSSSNNINGYFAGSPQWKTESECLSGKCIYFNGSSNITLPNAKAFGNTQYTVSAWVKLTNTGSSEYESLISFNNGALPEMKVSHGTYALLYLNSGANDYYRYGNLDLKDNKWHNIQFVFDDTTNLVKMYVDAIDRTGAGPNGNEASVTTSWLIGNGLKGWVDELKVYPYVRSAAQIKQDYRAGLAGQKAAKGVNVAAGSKSAKSLSDGLVGYWKMDEGVGTTTADSSGNSNTGTFGTGSSAPAWSTGKFGIGTSFNGSTHYVDIGTSSTFNIGTSNFAISLWFKTADKSQSNSSYRTLIAFGPYHGTSGWKFSIKSTDGKLESWWNNSARTTSTTGSLDDNQWHHVIYIRSGNTFTFYIDGQSNGSSTSSDSLGLTRLVFGTGGNNSVTDGGFWNGLIDEVRIYNRALSPAEVTALYEYAPGPVAYYNFEEGVGTTAFDKSGNTNNAVWSSSNYTTGKIGKAGNFTSSNHATLKNIDSLDIMGPITISAWVYPTTMNEANIIFSRGGGSANNCQYLLNIESGSPRFYMGNTNDLKSASAPTISTNKWHYLTGVFDGTKTYIYVNGVGISGGSITNQTHNTSYASRIGAYSHTGTYPFAGSIDEVKIYNYARTQKQILQDMNSNVPVGAATKVGKPIAWYKFDEGQGTVANNSGSIGSTINGTFGSGTSAPTWVTGKNNKGLSFDGNDYIRLPNTRDIDPKTNDYTWSGWLKFGGYTGTTRQIYMANAAGADYGIGFILDSSANRIRFEVKGTSGGRQHSYVDTINYLNQWHYWNFVLSGSDYILKAYIDGKLVLTQQLANWGSINSNGYLYFGSHYSNNWFYDGLIDEVKIYNYALSADEIKQDYNQGSSAVIGKSNQTIGGTTTSLDYCIPGDTSPCSPPIAEYNFEENIGTTAYDTSGNSNHIPFSSGTAIPSWTTGKIGAALNFDGSNDLAQKTNFNASQLNTAGTIECWFKAGTTQNGNARIVETGTAADRIGFFVNESSNNKLVLYWVKSGVGAAEVVSTNTINDNQWHYASGYWNSSGLFLYVDGIYNNTNPGDRTLNLGNSVNLTLGNYVGGGGGYTFNGKIDDIKIYNYARTPAQIAYDYNKGAPIGWWKMDECQGATIHNSAADPATAGLGSTGTIVIGAGGSQVSLGTCSIGDTSAWSNGSTGKINSAMSFDGTDDWISLSDSNFPTGASDRTITAWFKSNDITSSNRRIFGYGTWDVRKAFDIVVNGSKLYAISHTTNLTGIKTLSSNVWYHVAAIMNNGTITTYINGVVDTSGNFSTINTTLTGTGYIGLGASSNASFNGFIDDVRIYNYALTSEQVKQIYNGGAVSFN